MNEIKHTPGPVGFVNESALKQMLSGESVQCKLSRMKSGAMVYPLFDASVFADMAMALEMLAAEADAGTVMIPSALRLTIDAALIKAGRKAAPTAVRHVTIAGGAR
ncbi:hypothetical protein GT623_02525 [Burkholderia thailandensis]|nr:hypothetical protein [Burkholderia thailandensis]